MSQNGSQSFQPLLSGDPLGEVCNGVETEEDVAGGESIEPEMFDQCDLFVILQVSGQKEISCTAD